MTRTTVPSRGTLCRFRPVPSSCRRLQNPRPVLDLTHLGRLSFCTVHSVMISLLMHLSCFRSHSLTCRAGTCNMFPAGSFFSFDLNITAYVIFF